MLAQPAKHRIFLATSTFFFFRNLKEKKGGKKKDELVEILLFNVFTL